MLFAATLGQRHALGVAWPVHQTSGWHMLRYGPGCSIGSRSVVVGQVQAVPNAAGVSVGAAQVSVHGC